MSESRLTGRATPDRESERFGRRSQSRSARGGDYDTAEPATDDFARVGRRLYLDPARRRIVGVCAGIARYYGVEPWVIRLIAITMFLFLPGIVFPAYWVAYFIMERPPGSGGEWARQQWRTHRSRRREARRRDQYSSPTPELGPRISPRRGLRDVQADLTEVELRLRRMEAYVTSGRYELQRELHKIDPGTAR